MSNSENKIQLPKIPNQRVKTPTLLQMEAVECGAAALGIILSYYKKYVALEELRLECGVSRDGSKASNVVKAARRYGLKVKGYKKEPEKLFKEFKTPFIVYWNFNHFLVVEGYKNGRVYLNDPASGPRNISWEEFDFAYTGVVLVMEPDDGFIADGNKPGVIPALKKRFKGSELAMTFIVIAGLFMVVPGLVIPIFSKIFIDEYLVKNMESWLRALFLAMIVTTIINAGLSWLQQHYLLRFETKLSLRETGKFIWHVMRLPVEFFTQRYAGEISSRVPLNDNVASIVSGHLAINLIALLTIVFYLAVMFYYDVVLTLVGLFFVILNIVVLKLSSRKMTDLHWKISIDEGKMQGVSMGGIQSIETLKASGGESDFFQQWAGHQAKTLNGMQEVVPLNQIMIVLPTLLTAINVAAILSIGSLRVMDGYMTMGMLVAFQSLMMSFMTPINTLMGMGVIIQQLKGDLTRLDDVYKYPVDDYFDESLDDISNTKVKLDGYVELRSISFGYNPLEKALVEEFSFSLKPGNRVALVGASGCGKSTVTKLVSGLYKPWSGEVLLDGKVINKWSKTIFSNSVTMVDQEVFLFEGTVNENLTLWDKSIPEDQIVQACKDACIHDVIASMPNAYESYVEESGRNFSGGQRQRLEIARALVNNPSILIMDESTSALDPVTEKEVDENLRRRGCTCIIVAHRLSTIRDADEILVLDKGKIVHRGTHDELKELDGFYQQLIQTQ